MSRRKPATLSDLGLCRPTIRTISVRRINPAPYNPRADLQPGDPEYAKLAQGIKTFGMVQLLVWNQRTGNLVGGHQSFKVLTNELKAKTVAVAVVDLDDHKEKTLNIALNKIQGRWDKTRLDPLLQELADDAGFDAALTGFDASEIERLFAATAAELDTADPAAEPAPVDEEAGLAEDLKVTQRATKQKTLHLLHVSNAAKHLGTLPDPDEVIHCVMRGNYNAWDLVPAILKLIDPHAITDLYVATLSFNRKNAEELAALVRAKQIHRVTFLCSVYFEKTGGREYQSLVNALKAKPHRCLAARNHAKVTLMRTADDRHLVLESSANLRSCHNVEQLTLTDSALVWDFHANWMNELFAAAKIKRPR